MKQSIVQYRLKNKSTHGVCCSIHYTNRWPGFRLPAAATFPFSLQNVHPTSSGAWNWQLHLMPRSRITGATPSLRCIRSWLTQGQLYTLTFSLEPILCQYVLISGIYVIPRLTTHIKDMAERGVADFLHSTEALYSILSYSLISVWSMTL
jgi:hypothetical protein